MAEQAKILVAEAEENNLGAKARNERWRRWNTCSLCEQKYHGVVHCALGWACWKTYLGRPERAWARRFAINVLGNGLSESGYHQDALSVMEADLSMMLRIGEAEHNILALQGNLATTYQRLGRPEEALRMKRDLYSRRLKLNGEEHCFTLTAALNYASSLKRLRRFKEARSMLRKSIPVALRVLREGDDLPLRMKATYAMALYDDPGATLDDLREAVTTLEETERTARRVLGGAHPLTEGIEDELRDARAALAARETPSASA